MKDKRYLLDTRLEINNIINTSIKNAATIPNKIFWKKLLANKSLLLFKKFFSQIQFFRSIFILDIKYKHLELQYKNGFFYLIISLIML